MIVLSFDIEERFHSHLTDGSAPREWTAGDRVARLLDLLEERGCAATFFVVAELAERYPALIRRMTSAEFELGSHTYSHLRLDDRARRVCIDDIARSKQVLEDVAGVQVVGFRAPTWTASRSDEWLWDHLISLGFLYDSSLFPFRTHLYGSNDNPVRPFWLRPDLCEIPPSVAVWRRLRLPYGGGFYFRLYPGWITRRLIDRDARDGHAPVVYLHPWDFESEERPLETGLINRFIGNVSTGSTWERLRGLLARYETRTLRSVYDALAERRPEASGARS